MNRVKFLNYVKNAILTTPTYPNCRVNGENPYDEQIMSMPSMVNSSSATTSTVNMKIKGGRYFFFIFNLSNYFHFIYDTLPYLAHHMDMNSDSKLLLPKDHKWLRFQREFLELLGYKQFEYAEDDTSYEHLYIPSSFTHGKTKDKLWASNQPPSEDAFRIWEMLRTSTISTQPRKFYVSRRTWIHGDTSNIGTNYTMRRRCMNEDEVVDTLKDYGYEEIFTENISTVDKIALFQNATHIIGFIGGGMANILFSDPPTKVGCINTPEFLKINERFKYTMDHTRCNYANITYHSPYEGPYPLYTRIKVTDITSPYHGKIGEIESHDATNNVYSIKMSNNDVAGFAQDNVFELADFSYSQFETLDNGLNSPFLCDINGLRALAEYLDKP